MDKVIISMLLQKTGENEPYKTHTVAKMIIAHRGIVRHFRVEVEDHELSDKRVKMLFDWSNAYLKKLDQCKDRFYPSHRDVSYIFGKYYEDVKRLKTASRRSLEKGLKAVLTEGSKRAIAKKVQEGKL